MIYVCLEHIEEAIDHFTYEYQEPPDIFLLEQLEKGAESAPPRCRFCELPPAAVLKRYAD